MGRRVRDEVVQQLFDVIEDLPGREGMDLLRAFAENRPSDVAFFKSNDLGDLKNSAFTGIAEWDAFSDHYGCCGLYHA